MPGKGLIYNRPNPAQTPSKPCPKTNTKLITMCVLGGTGRGILANPAKEINTVYMSNFIYSFFMPDRNWYTWLKKEYIESGVSELNTSWIQSRAHISLAVTESVLSKIQILSSGSASLCLTVRVGQSGVVEGRSWHLRTLSPPTNLPGNINVGLPSTRQWIAPRHSLETRLTSTSCTAAKWG